MTHKKEIRIKERRTLKLEKLKWKVSADWSDDGR